MSFIKPSPPAGHGISESPALAKAISSRRRPHTALLGKTQTDIRNGVVQKRWLPSVKRKETTCHRRDGRWPADESRRAGGRHGCSPPSVAIADACHRDPRTAIGLAGTVALPAGSEKLWEEQRRLPGQLRKPAKLAGEALVPVVSGSLTPPGFWQAERSPKNRHAV